MKDQASVTALMSAFGRAYHAQNDPQPIFCDSVARALMTDEEYAAMGGYILGGLDFFAPERRGSFADDAQALRYLVNTQIAPTPLARAAYCEEKLKRSDAEQYVILGAGLDSFALREREFLKKCSVFELDHPATQADKRARIRRAGLETPKELHLVSADLSKDDFCCALRSGGFDPKKKSFFSWLGVSYYLTQRAIEATLDGIAALGAEGSSLVFDFADRGVVDCDLRRVQCMRQMAAAGGEPMLSSFDPDELAALLRTHGFAVKESLSPEDIQARYFAGRGEELTAFEHIHYLHAILQKH